MHIGSAKTKSVPFPKEGFQKWDVITPKDSEYYGEKFVVVDYRRWNFDTGEVKYYYHLETLFGCKYETDLNGYEKLYSKRRDIALDMWKCIKRDIKPLLDREKYIQEALNIDTGLLTEGIEKIKAFIEVLEHTR